MPKTRRETLQELGQSLKKLRTPYEAHLSEIGDHFMPRRTRFNAGKSHRSSDHVNKKLVNSRPRLALRTMQSGMHTGMTSPARPWFRLLTVDPDLRKQADIKEHLTAAQRAMRQLLQSSGAYNVLHTLWGDLGWSGTDCMIIEDDLTRITRPLALVPGEYWIGANSDGVVDTLYREVSMPIQYIVGKFVFGGLPNAKPQWDRVSSEIKKMWDRGDYGHTREVCHVIIPRQDRDPRGWMPEDKPIASTYWEKEAGKHDVLLGDFGYDHNPIIASRWDVEGTNVYGSSPAMDALPDAKTLQVQEKDKREAIKRMNRPPMNAPSELRNSAYSLMPEAVNYMADPTKGLVPAYQVNPPYQHLLAEIEATEARIDEAMYAQLFLMISRLDRRQITAREIDERHEEKLLGLGPVLERQHLEKLGPLIKTLYRAVVSSGRVPPLPEQYADVDVEIDYISMLAQAQKAVATGGMERLYGFIGNLMAADETVIDNVDNDEAVSQYAEMLGVPGEVVRPEQEREEIRQRRMEQAQRDNEVEEASQMAPVAKQAAEAGKVLKEADATGKPVDILRNLGLR